MRLLRWTALATLLLLLGAGASVAKDPADACAAAKEKAAAKKASAKLACWAKAARNGTADPDCLQKAETKFTAAFAKAEAKGGCATSGDASTVETMVDDFVAQVVGAESGSTTTTTMSCTGQVCFGVCFCAGSVCVGYDPGLGIPGICT
jgi:hypothetical protein